MLTTRPRPDKDPTEARQKPPRQRSVCAALAFVGEVSVKCRCRALPNSAPTFPSSSPTRDPLLSGLSVLSVGTAKEAA